MRIREFDGSGGRIELYCALVHSVLTMSPVVLQSLAEKSVKELVLGVFVSPHSFCNSFNFLSGSRVRARIGLNSVHSVIPFIAW